MTTLEFISVLDSALALTYFVASSYVLFYNGNPCRFPDSRGSNVIKNYKSPSKFVNFGKVHFNNLTIGWLFSI